MENSAKTGDVKALEQQVEKIIEEWLESGISIIDYDTPFDSSDSEDGDNYEDDDNDDDGEPPVRRRKIVDKNYVIDTIRPYSDTEFKNHFKLSRRIVYSLIEKFQKNVFLTKEVLDKNINHENAFIMTISYLTSTESFKEIAQRFGFSQLLAFQVLQLTLKFINSLTDEYIKWPMDEVEKQRESKNFAKNKYIHGVIGAIDTCHIRIKRPIENEEEYLHLNGHYSIILQAVVNSRKLFTDVYVGEPGTMQKDRVLRRSPMFKMANNPDLFGDYFIIGDSSYPSLPWLVPQFPNTGHLTNREKLFNYRHAYTHIKVHQAFVLLRRKFRRLLHFNNISLDIINKCIMAMCILHNVCILNNDNDELNDSDDEETNAKSNRNVLEGDGFYKKIDKRQMLFCQMFLSN